MPMSRRAGHQRNGKNSWRVRRYRNNTPAVAHIADASLPYVWQAAYPAHADFSPIDQPFAFLPRNVANEFSWNAEPAGHERREALAKRFGNLRLTSRKSQHDKIL